jgi:hypothetical protein
MSLGKFEKRNPFSEASKERRRLANSRNSFNTQKNDSSLATPEKKDPFKEKIDLKRKDNISPKGLYV